MVAIGRAAVRAAPTPSLGLAAVVAAVAALPAGLAVAAGGLVGGLTRPGAHTVDRGVTHLVAGTALAMGVLFLMQQVLPQVATAIAENLGRRLDRAIAERVMIALHRPAGVEHLEDGRTAEMVSSLNGSLTGTTARDAIVGVANTAIVRGGAVAGVLILLGYRWWLVIVLLGAHGCAMVLISRGYQRALKSAESVPTRVRRAMYLKDLLSTAPAGKEVRVFGLVDWLLAAYRDEWARALADVRRARGGVGRTSLVGFLVVLGAQSLAMLLLAVDAMNGRVSLGWFTAGTVAATGLVGLSSVTPALVHIAAGGSALRMVDELEERTGRIAAEEERARRLAVARPAPAGRAKAYARAPGAEHGGPAVAEDAAPRPRQAVVFEQVGFRYPGTDGWVLRGLDLTIPIGSSTAIVGYNGAGKTTLLKLLCGLRQPTEGRILVDGVDVREHNPRAWQRCCAVLFQDWVRWALSMRDNVLLGAPDHPDDPAELSALAETLGLAAVVDQLPAGWSTMLSREFGGVGLSGGQWQRIGLARALWALRAGAEILVLDEPTAALDVRGETELFDLLLAAARERTVVLVSHRFSTVRRANQIVVLADGSVCEQGEHAALMASNGRYASMFAVQAQHFADGVTR